MNGAAVAYSTDLPSLSLAEVEERYGAECLVLLDYQCPHIARADTIRFWEYGSSSGGPRLGVMTRELDAARAARVRASWKLWWPANQPVDVTAKWWPGPGLWIRYSRGITSHPRRELTAAELAR